MLAPYGDDRHPDHAGAARLLTEACFLAGLRRYGSGEPHRDAGISLHAAHIVRAHCRRRRRHGLAVAARPVRGVREPDHRCGPADGLNDGGFLALLEARAVSYGAQTGVAHAEPLHADGPLLVQALPEWDRAPARHARLPGQPVTVPLAACSASPLAPSALRALTEHAQAQADEGSRAFGAYWAAARPLPRDRGTPARRRRRRISFHRNATEALSLIANGYPFEPGDDGRSPTRASHYPWRALEARGVRLVNSTSSTPEAIERALTARTRVVALSHVQFVTGFALDLEPSRCSAAIPN